MSGNPDSDTCDGIDYTNLQEYLHGTNPNEANQNLSPGILFVYPGGSAIGGMINQSVPGDTIIVTPGTYNTNITVGKASRTITSINPNDWEITARTILSPVPSSTDPVVRIKINLT